MDNAVKRIEARPHRVTIDGRERITITSVQDVDSFNENEVIFLTGVGMMTVMGEDMHISKLDLESGTLVIDGTIVGLDYSDHEEQRSGGLFKRVFR